MVVEIARTIIPMLEYQLIEVGSEIFPTNKENAARLPTPVIKALNLKTSRPPINIFFEQ